MSATVTFYATTDDCWANKNNDFGNTEDYLYVIDNPGVTNSNVVTYIPFVVNLPRVMVEQAFLYVTPYASGVGGIGNIIIGCEDADNPTAPATGADVNSRVFTDFTTTATVGEFVADTEKNYQIDNPVQEIFDRAGWQHGNTMAVMIKDDGIGDITRQIYSREGGSTAKCAKLVIVFTDWIPRAEAFY